MIYFTGDTHGGYRDIIKFCNRQHLLRTDVIIILGDAGYNYYSGERDAEAKLHLSHVKPTILCIHGNHEIRPTNIPTYKTKEWNGGIVWYEEEYPNLLFAKDGEIYILNGLNYLAIGGAYSVDKHLRLRRGAGWWEDEQPSDEIKRYVEEQIRAHRVDVILSHTCPRKYIPTEVFLPMVDQSTVDNSTEIWLDQIEEAVNYKTWYCGHWHTDKRIDRMHFLYRTFESEEEMR
ncbi:MAG: metallophosphoesterase [Clostridia bacterium]|nr:metallophosphoesterase [Clostridia bacterium]